MNRGDLQKATFVKTATNLAQCPKPMRGTMEVAVVGRSNVGKSTLLNHLFRRKGLVKTSATPGKTQALQFFSCGEHLLFVDLPGYGYAKASGSARKKWAQAIEEYFEKREAIHLVLFLLDIRRNPSEEDRQFFEWASDQGIPFLIVFTKADKLGKNQCQSQVARNLKVFGQHIPHVLYSAPKNIGRDQLIQAIFERLEGEELGERG